MAAQKLFFAPAEIESLKQSVKITDYLSEHNYFPTHYKNNEWYYSSIGIEERTPSFRVNVVKNVYQDYSGNLDNTGRCGDIIRLVMHLENCDFLEACNRLNTFEFTNTPKAIETKIVDKTEKDSIIVNQAFAVRSRSLINYLGYRRISLKLADMYLKEVHYKNAGGEFYALGFRNDLGGFALRSPGTRNNPNGFKAQTKPNYFTTILPHRETNTCNIFEGFFSALSCLEHYQRLYFDNRTYVLNSVVANLPKLLPQIPDHITHINLFLDADASGRKYTKKVVDLEKFQVNDCTYAYKGHKDFNDYIMSK